MFPNYSGITDDPVIDAERYCMECESGKEDYDVCMILTIRRRIPARNKEEAIDLVKREVDHNMMFTSLSDYEIEEEKAEIV